MPRLIATLVLAANAARPFFLEVAYNGALGVPGAGSPVNGDRQLAARDADAENPGTRADQVKILERADQGVGEILAALDKLGLSRNTIVIFTNDNGGEWLS